MISQLIKRYVLLEPVSRLLYQRFSLDNSILLLKTFSERILIRTTYPSEHGIVELPSYEGYRYFRYISIFIYIYNKAAVNRDNVKPILIFNLNSVCDIGGVNSLNFFILEF